MSGGPAAAGARGYQLGAPREAGAAPRDGWDRVATDASH